MSSESELLLQYQESKDRLVALKADYDVIFSIANTPEEFATLSVIADQMRAEERILKEIHANLPPRESFGAKYSVEMLGPNQIAFVIPANVPPIRILEEVQEIHSALEKRNYVFPNRYKVWLQMPSFTEAKMADRAICIDGCVEESQNRTLADQKFFLKRKFEGGEATIPTVEDLAVAHAMYFIVARQDIFRGIKVRALTGSLYFDNLGLGLDRFSLDWNRFHDVGAACYPPLAWVEKVREERRKGR